MKKRTPKAGFTLIEISLALLVLAVGILAIVGVTSSSFESGRKAQDELHAVAFADMVFGYYQTQTNWNFIPPSTDSQAFKIYDYANTIVTLKTGTPTHFINLALDCIDQPIETATLTYQLDARDHGKTKELNLQIWPGYQTSGRANIFHINLYNWQQE